MQEQTQEQMLEKLIAEQKQKAEDLKQGATSAIRDHYILAGAYRQACDHLAELQQLLGKIKKESKVTMPMPMPPQSSLTQEELQQVREELRHMTKECAAEVEKEAAETKLKFKTDEGKFLEMRLAEINEGLRLMRHEIDEGMIKNAAHK